MSRGDDSELKSEPQRVVLEAGETPAPLRFELAGRLGVRGYVRFPSDGVEGSSPNVHILPLAPAEEVDLEALSDSRESTWARSGSEYSFLDLDAGRYAVGVSRSWSGPIEAHEVVEVTDGIVRCDLELPPVDRSKLLHVAVLGADGAPIIGVDFSLRVESEHGGWSGGGVQEMTDSDGSYLLTLDAEHQEDYFGGGGGKTFTLTASHEEYGSKSEKLQPGRLEVTIVLAPPGKLEVTIAGYQGSGFEGRLNVTTEKVGEEEQDHWFRGGRNRMSSTGVQKLEGLSPGRYALQLWLEPEENRRWRGGRPIDRIEISVAAGENFATMTIPALYSFDVIYLDGKEGTTFGLSRSGGDNEFFWGFNAELDSTGKARFEDVPAGDYTLSCWGGRMQKMEIRVPCKNIEFVPMLLNALLVKIADESGDMAKLGFRTGDLIVGIDGREFDGEPDMSLFSPLFASKSAKITFLVQRGGESLEIEVTGSQIGDWGTLGGEVEPTAR